MARLPSPGGDKGTWGDILNQFLEVEHNSDGSLKASGTLSSYAPLANPTFTGSVTVPSPLSGTDAVNKDYADTLVSSGAPDADASTKGLIQLTGDLTGTASSPQIAAGAIVNADINAAAAIAQSKIANLTADLAGKQDSLSYTPEDLANKDTDTSLAANSDTKYPSQKAIKTYTDTKLAKSTVTTKGDLLVATAASTITRIGVGSDNQVLTADSSQTSGVKWATPITGGDASTNTSTSVDSELALFSGTSGKTLKRATGSGIVKLTSGVLSTATSGTDYVSPTGSETLTNKTLTSPVFNTGVSGTAIDTDTSLTANSDTIIASQKATKAYVDTEATNRANAIIALPSLIDGFGTTVDTSISGFISIKRSGYAIKGTSVSNTTTESNLINTSPWTTAANTFTVEKSWIHLQAFCSLTNNTGSTRNVTYNLKANGSTVVSWTSSAIPSSATFRQLLLEANILFTNVIGVRAVAYGARITIGPAATSGADYAASELIASSSPVVDLTSSINWTLTATLSTASSSLNTTLSQLRVVYEELTPVS